MKINRKTTMLINFFNFFFFELLIKIQISSKKKEITEAVQKRDSEIKELNKAYLTLESEYNYHQAVTKKNENELNQILSNLNNIQVKNNDVSYEALKKQNIIK